MMIEESIGAAALADLERRGHAVEKAPAWTVGRLTAAERGDDGLRDPWWGRVWLNPPYGKAQEPFLRRLVEHGAGTALIFARTETRQWHELVWPKATAVLFIQGRLNFLDANGERSKANAGAPSALVAYGNTDSVALAASGIPGHLVKLQEEEIY